MATIIELGGGRFIAGDPEVPVGYRACGSCGGSGLEYDFDGELVICWCCPGSGRGERMHPLVPVAPF